VLLALWLSALFLALMGALLFGSAGRWDLPFFWAYLGVWGAASGVGSVACDPSLTRERLRPGPGARFFASDFLIGPLWVAQSIVAGLDVGRFHWSDGVPRPVQVVAMVGMAAALAVGVWAASVNKFFSSAVRIQTDRGHRVITDGPYRFVRHPGYAASHFIFAGGGLALGSWLAALIGALIIPCILYRTAQEDRFLQGHLPGYADYARQVRYRLVPGVW
jgi:protein-S-isoprenylcysteine O-methyltransferase Ste14